MKTLLTIFMLVSSLSFAQKASKQEQTVQQFASFSTGGGNGGDPIELRVMSVISELREFFSNKGNRVEFPEINFDDFMEASLRTKAKIIEIALFDKHGTERCLLNENYVITINKTCWQENLGNEQDHFAMVFHELLGQIGVETAGKYIPSEYSVSSRLGKFVQKIERYGLINLSLDEPLKEIAFSCDDRRREYYEGFSFMISLNDNNSFSVFARSQKQKNVDGLLHDTRTFFYNLFSKQRREFQIDVGRLKKSDLEMIFSRDLGNVRENNYKKQEESYYNPKNKTLYLKQDGVSYEAAIGSFFLNFYNDFSLIKSVNGKDRIYDCMVSQLGNSLKNYKEHDYIHGNGFSKKQKLKVQQFFRNL